VTGERQCVSSKGKVISGDLRVETLPWDRWERQREYGDRHIEAEQGETLPETSLGPHSFEFNTPCLIADTTYPLFFFPSYTLIHQTIHMEVQVILMQLHKCLWRMDGNWYLQLSVY